MSYRHSVTTQFCSFAWLLLSQYSLSLSLCLYVYLCVQAECTYDAYKVASADTDKESLMTFEERIKKEEARP